MAKAIARSLEDAERANRAAAAGHDDEALARSLDGEHQGHHLLDEDAQFARDMEMAWKIKDEEASAAQQAEQARLARRAAAEAEDERLARALMESQTLEARAPRARRDVTCGAHQDFEPGEALWSHHRASARLARREDEDVSHTRMLSAVIHTTARTRCASNR